MWTRKIEHAKQLKEELQKEIKSFLDSQPYKVDVKLDLESKRPVYYLVKADKVPERIALVTGDIIQNLRSSLDHLAYKLFTASVKEDVAGRHIYFPIANNFDQYEKDKSRKTEGLTQQAKDLIDSVKPYKGGNDIIWKIHELSNLDKHRLLVTVGSSFKSVGIGTHIRKSMIEAFPNVNPPAISLFIKPANSLFPLKVGDKLFMDAPNAKPIPDMQFKFSVVINEPKIVEGEPPTELVQTMIKSVSNLIPKFKTLVS